MPFASQVAAVLFAAGLASPAGAGLGPLPASWSDVLPCADCAGIRHQLNLFPGGGYMLALTYLRDGHDETFYDLGAWSMGADSSQLVLDHGPDGMRFAVQEDGPLRMHDREGHAVRSHAPYDLRREPSFVPIEPRLSLLGSFFYMADAGVLTECRSGMRFPVEGPAAGDLERAFLAERSTRDSLARATAGRGGRGRADRSRHGSSRAAPQGAAPDPLPTASWYA